MTTVTTRNFRSGNSEAVRLPKEIAFGRDLEITAIRSGDVIMLYPLRQTFHDMLKRLDALPKPATVEVRDVSEIPERSRL